VYDFGRATAGEHAKHEFIFTNTGTEVLIISNVAPACHCTTAGDWTHQVEPGKTGVIPLVFDSSQLPAGPIAPRFVKVTCNDKTQPSLFLEVKGTVWLPINVDPQRVMLSLTPDVETTAVTVRIHSNLDQPLTLSPPESSDPVFAAELRTNQPGKDYAEVVAGPGARVELPTNQWTDIRVTPDGAGRAARRVGVQTNQPGKDYQLVVSNSRALPPGSLQGRITMRTSSTNVPVLTVDVFAFVLPVLQQYPLQLNLPPAPLARQTDQTISIVHNSTNAVSFTEPAINAKGVDIAIKEVQPNKFFTVTLSFPEGFEAPRTEALAFTLKTSNSNYPLIRVPIVQAAAPAAPRPLPGTAPGTVPRRSLAPPAHPPSP
jgi:hypothetical protein